MKKKWGEKNARNNFSRITRIVGAKNVGKKIVSKVRKYVFYTHTNIVAKKWGEKKRETIFAEKHEYCQQKNVVKKIVSKSAKTRFLYSHEYRDQKMGGKIARNNF